MKGPGEISANSRRVARNTMMLYGRMLLLMFIGLFTSRVVLKALGVEDYGVYNAVGGVVMVFTFLTATVSTAISRYLSFELGGRVDGAPQDAAVSDRLHRIFSTSVLIMLGFAVLLVALVETGGMWWLHHKLVIPEGRMPAAEMVLQFSLGVLFINMLAVPYNAAIIAHERMSAFAVISFIEAVLKLAVALLLAHSPYDKLMSYAALMLAVALIVRLSYGIFCRRHFPESRGRIVYDGHLVREMAGFAGWSFFGSSAYVFNTQGVNLAVNSFFGVTMNAARGLAGQVDGIIKQFVTNFLTALNPQITKTWASGDKDYCFELVRKGTKYSFLVILAFFIPILFEAELLLDIWLEEVPAHAAAFVRLTVVGLLVDLVGNSLLMLVLATGKVKKYYLVTGLTSYLGLPLVWLLFRLGAMADWAYVVFIGVYLVVFVERLVFADKLAGFPVGKFLKDVVLRLLLVTSQVLLLPLLLCWVMPDGWLRLVLVCVIGWTSLALWSWSVLLTPGEQAFIFRKVARFLPDRVFVTGKYRFATGHRMDPDMPLRYTEKLQWLKIHDHNPLYHTLADKAEVKAFVADRIGADHVIPTLAVWDSVDEIDWEALPERFVLKCTHDSGSTLVCRDKSSFDRAAACRSLDAALKQDFYKRDREWVYKGITPRIIAEEYLCDEPADYKFFCFDGKPELMFVATDRFTEGEETKFDFFDMSFNHIDVLNGHPNAAVTPAEPQTFELMKELAARLSEGLLHVRIDFYEVDGKVYFGEYTFYHWSGFVPFVPDSFDRELGKKLHLPLK